MFEVSFEFVGLDEACHAYVLAADDAMDEAVVGGAEFVADDARRTHPYQNRTGRLEANTVAGVALGAFSGDTLHVYVFGDTPYGGFLEDGTDRIPPGKYSFLAPAWRHSERAFGQFLRRGLWRAADFSRAYGWSPRGSA